MAKENTVRAKAKDFTNLSSRTSSRPRTSSTSISLFIINFQEDLLDFEDPGKSYHSNRLVILKVLLFICCGPGSWVEKGVVVLPCFLDLIMTLSC